jgi:hypothetical protein
MQPGAFLFSPLHFSEFARDHRQPIFHQGEHSRGLHDAFALFHYEN